MKRSDEERKTDCFAYSESGDRCVALSSIDCSRCAFYKSKEVLRAEALRCSDRLTELKFRTTKEDSEQ